VTPGSIPGFDSAFTERVTQARLAMLSTLVAGLAHEINTPLGALNSNHDVLRRALVKLQDILEDEVVEPHELEEVRRIVRALDGILQVNDLAVERMSALVLSMRNFGRPDRALTDHADLHECLDSTLAIIAHQLAGISVERDYGTLPLIECRPQQLNQVFLNLLLNAAQAMPDGGTLSIRTRVAGDGVRIEIRDTGKGIAAANLTHIFEPGFTTKDARIGMGLGLLISRQIVDAHGGRIDVASEVGVGSTFTVQVPLRQVARPASSPTAEQEV
jgi:two-component system, NtrC family, sensor kinase